MGKTHNPILELYPATFNDKEFTSANHLSKALLTQSEWLSPMVTHAFGTSASYGRRNFPLSFITEGMGNTQGISSTDLSYKIAVIGKPKKTSFVASTPYLTGDTPGKGHAKFKVVFADRWFYKSQSIYSPTKVECRVQSDPVQVQDGWEYELKIMNPNELAYVSLADLQPGATWGRGIAKVGKERSRGVESRSYAPFATQNQLSVVRGSYKIAGNVQNKVMVLSIKADGKEFKFWTQWELFLRQLEWKEMCETDLWYSTYNKDEYGVINVEDEDSGEVVPSGAGLLQQIPNSDTYSILTTTKLETLVTDIFFNAADADIVNVEIYTGTGGLREASRSMESAAKAFTMVDTNFIQKNKQTGFLTYGAYFNTYIHRDGHTVTFKKLPMMDKGVIADISNRHPNDNLPLESYNMYCVDNSVYDGQRNLTYVSEKGREDINFVVPGASVPKGYGDTMFRSSDIDASSVEWMRSQGIAVYKPVNCFKLTNTLTN